MKWRDGASIIEMGMSEKGTGLKETKLKAKGTPLVVQSLALCAASAGGMGSTLAWESKIPHVVCHGQNKRIKI